MYTREAKTRNASKITGGDRTMNNITSKGALEASTVLNTTGNGEENTEGTRRGKMKPELKNVILDNDNEELISFAKDIDFSELFDHLRAFAKVDCDFYQPEITTSRGNVYISFMSKDITNHTGIFATILRCCYFCSFSNGVYKDRETGELGYWVSVSVRYNHKNGGENGMELTTARYHKGRWEFQDVG